MNKDRLLGSFLFNPERGFLATPDMHNLIYQDVIFRAADGTGLHGWFFPSISRAGARPLDNLTIMVLHGVGGNISHRLDYVSSLLSHLTANIFLFDYRGYGRSSGSPTEEGTFLDAEAALQTLRGMLCVQQDRIVLIGHSLGGAIAIETAARVGDQVSGLVVESSFTTGRDVARLLFPVVPDPAMPAFYDSINRICQVSVPVLIAHGTSDSLLPASMARKLFLAAQEPKHLYLVPNADHHDIHVAGGGPYFGRLGDFFATCVP